MRPKTLLHVSALGAGVALLVAAAAPLATSSRSSQSQGARNDISGVVTSPSGPEAGVWVIAETSDLPTKYVKIVVTDDRGRYVIPELPRANYNVWVRGYGLVDSPKRSARPGVAGPLGLVSGRHGWNEIAGGVSLGISTWRIC